MNGTASSASKSTSYKIHAGTIAKAVKMTWDNQYKEAMELLKTKKSTQPRYALEWAGVYIVESLMSSTNESRDNIIKLLGEAETLARSQKYNDSMFSDDEDSDCTESAVPNPTNQKETSYSDKKKEFKKQKKDALQSNTEFDENWKLECEVIYADAILLRAICQIMMNSYLKGGLNLRIAWGMFHGLIQRVENDTTGSIPEDLTYAIKYGAGLFYTFLALVPASLMKLLTIVGFISDKELGEKYLTEVFLSSSIRAPYAALTLCTMYLFLPTGLGDLSETLVKAKRVLDEMNSRFPNNTYFYGYSNFYYRKSGDLDAALNSITIAVNNAEKVGLAPLLIRYLRADTLFMCCEWKKAKEVYISVIDHLAKTKEKFAYTGQIALSIAGCCVMLHQKEEGLEWVKKVKSMYNPKSKNDSNSPKIANRIIANPRLFPLTAVHVLYINRDLTHMTAEQGSRVLEEMNKILEHEDTTGPEAENMTLLFRGVIFKGCGRTQEAIQYFNEILANEKNIPQDLMILPFTYYELAEMEYRLDHWQKAKTLFEKGSKIKGDKNETLSNRYSIAMKQLKKKMEAK